MTESQLAIMLTDFCKWLEASGYLDDDWWCEEPKAIEEYLKHKRRKKI